MGCVPVTWHSKSALSPTTASTGVRGISKKGGFFPSEETLQGEGFTPGSRLRPHPLKKQQCFLSNFVSNYKHFSYRNIGPGIHEPVRMSLAPEEAEPTGFVAVQEYWPARLLSVLKMFRVATLSKNDVCTFGLSFNGLPSLYQDTEMGSDPCMAHSKTTGNPTVSCTSLSCRENDGGSFCSAGTGLKQWTQLFIFNLVIGIPQTYGNLSRDLREH